MIRRIVLPLLLLAAAVGVATSAPARAKRCKIPVFRYALERWRATPYEAFLFYRGKLGKKDLETIAVLKDSFPANVYVESVDLSSEKIPEDLKGIWAAQGDATLPSLVVLYPPHPSQPLDAPAAWRGTPGPEIARTIVDSPVRREISKRILEGESAVWLLIESGDKAADDAAVKLLERELKDLEETLDVPALQELEEDPGSPALIAEVPLRLAFSVLRVNREDSAEKMFVGMILNADDNLAKEKGPIALPIIGRGRALWPLYGEELNDEQIFQAADFLVGACSCQVKELNPGMDLIFKTDWEAVLSGFPLEEPAPILEGPVKVAIPAGTVAADVPVPPPAPAPESAPPQGGGSYATWIVLLLVVGAGVLLLSRGRGGS